MVDVVYLGNQNKGRSGLGDTLVPLALLGGLALFAVYFLPGLVARLSGTGSGTGGTGGTIGATSTAQQLSAAVAGAPAAVSSWLQAVTTPGTYLNAQGQAVQGTGLGGLFVLAGLTTPYNLFPAGNVITESTPLSASQQGETLSNLCANTSNPNAWWLAPGICPAPGVS